MKPPRLPQRRITDAPTPDVGLLIVTVLAAWGFIGLLVFGAITAWRVIQWALSL